MMGQLYKFGQKGILMENDDRPVPAYQRLDPQQVQLDGSTRAFRIRDLVPLDSSTCAGTN